MTSPIASMDLIEMAVCVIGADLESAYRLGQAIVAYVAAEVDVVPLDRRGVYRASRRPYGIVVFDAHPSDSLALVNDLARRLSGTQPRARSVVVCLPGGDVTPVLERLIQRTKALVARRPLDAGTFMQVVAAASGTALAGATVS
jgi:hypothetical protein